MSSVRRPAEGGDGDGVLAGKKRESGWGGREEKREIGSSGQNV